VRHFTPGEANAALERVRPLVEQMVAQRREHLEALERQEELERLEKGLIDVPALRHGETVLLCWKLGEDEIRYWHHVEDGFAGRQELPLE
jgi:hypothetical protein